MFLLNRLADIGCNKVLMATAELQKHVYSAILSSSQSKNPILRLSKHPLIIQDVHSKIKHSGIKNTLTTIRERF